MAPKSSNNNNNKGPEASSSSSSSSSFPLRTQNKYQMVALDLDGTLLNSNHELDKQQAQYLLDLYNKGFTICLATGRAAPSVYEHVQTLNLPHPIPIVCSNGARGMMCDSSNLQKQELLFYNPVPHEVVQQAIRQANTMGFALQYYVDDAIYANQKTKKHYDLTKQYTKLTGSTVQHVDDDFTSQTQLPSKVLVLFDESELTKAVESFKKIFDNGQATIVLGAFDWFLEILHPNVTKGHGLQNMCQHLDIPIDKCIAIGDGANDLEFLKMSGLGISMNNARDVVKDAADEVMEWTNDENGVMKTLMKMEQDGLLEFK